MSLRSSSRPKTSSGPLRSVGRTVLARVWMPLVAVIAIGVGAVAMFKVHQFSDPEPVITVNTPVNISHANGNQTEPSIAVNPANPNQLFAFCNVDTASSLFAATSADGAVSGWSSGRIST